MVGIDLVLPDFTYLRERADDIEGIVITHGHEDHLGALPWVLRELAEDIPVFGGPLTMAMARSKLDEHRLKETDVDDVKDGEHLELGPFDVELVHMTHSIPDASAVAIHTELGTVLITGDYKFDQTPSTACPPTSGAWRSSAPRACCCSAATRRTPTARASRRASGRRARAGGGLLALRGAHRRHELRLEHPPRAAGRRRRRGAGPQGRLVGRSMRKNVNIGRSLGHIDVPEGILVQPREIEQWPDDKLVIISTGSPGRAAERAAPHGPPRPSADRAARRRHRRLQRDADPRQRARGQRDGRPALPHRLRRHHDRRRADPRLRPRVRGGDQADAQPRAPDVRDAVPRRPQAHPPARQARRGGRDRRRRTSSRARTACRWRSTRRARASAPASGPG